MGTPKTHVCPFLRLYSCPYRAALLVEANCTLQLCCDEYSIRPCYQSKTRHHVPCSMVSASKTPLRLSIKYNHDVQNFKVGKCCISAGMRAQLNISCGRCSESHRPNCPMTIWAFTSGGWVVRVVEVVVCFFPSWCLRRASGTVLTFRGASPTGDEMIERRAVATKAGK